MPQDNEYTRQMLLKFKTDIVKLVGPQHEGCYRVDILIRHINELTVTYLENLKSNVPEADYTR